MLISYSGPRKLVHTATFELVSLTFSKLSSFLFRDIEMGGDITKRSKGVSNRSQDCVTSGEREGCDRKGHLEFLRGWMGSRGFSSYFL